MEIKLFDIYEKCNNNSTAIVEELNKLVLGKTIEIYEYDKEDDKYDYLAEYKIDSLEIWENDLIVFWFGIEQWDICSFNKADLLKIKD